MSVLLTATVIAAFVCIVLMIYQQQKFFSEWREDNKHLSILTRERLSTTALFSRSLSERCRSRRRYVLLAWAAFFLTFVIRIILERWS